MLRPMAVVVLLGASISASASAPEGDKKFHWTTESERARTLIADLQARIENFQFGTETVELARELVSADPDFAMGVYYLSAVIPSEAEAQLARAVELASEASEGERRFIEAMATVRAGGGNFADGAPLLEKLAEDYPDERLIQMILGQLYQGLGDGKRARAAFEKALDIGPPSQRARSFLANDDLLRGEYARARASFQAIAKELPRGAAPAAVRYGVAFSYLYEGKDEAAIDALRIYLDEYRESGASQNFPEVFIWNSIARIHLENGRARDALDAYQRGYESVPESGLPDDQKELWLGRLKHGRCRALAKMGRHDEAWKEAEEIRAMIEAGDESAEQYLPAYHYLIGYLKLEAGEPEVAVEHLKQASPSDPFHQLLLARALDRAGKPEEARDAYRSVVESTNNGLERALAYREATLELEKS